MGCKLGMDPRQVENCSDLTNQVIVGNGLFKTKRVKQPTLVVIEPPHHRPTPPRIVSERRNHCSREPSTTFATKSATRRRRHHFIRSPDFANAINDCGMEAVLPELGLRGVLLTAEQSWSVAP